MFHASRKGHSKWQHQRPFIPWKHIDLGGNRNLKGDGSDWATQGAVVYLIMVISWWTHQEIGEEWDDTKTVSFIYISIYLNIYIDTYLVFFKWGVARLKLSLCLMQKVLHLESLPKIVPGTRRLENCTVPFLCTHFFQRRYLWNLGSTYKGGTVYIDCDEVFWHSWKLM